MFLRSPIKYRFGFAAVGLGIAALTASAQQEPAKPVELFKREACVAPIQNKFNGLCIVRGATSADGRFNEPSAHCTDELFVPAAENCLRNAFRRDDKVAAPGPVQACLEITFGPASAKMPGYVRFAEMPNCPPPGARIKISPLPPPARLMLDSNSPYRETCTNHLKVKWDVDMRCLVRGELNQDGRVAKSSADCEDKRFEKAAANCAQAFKLKDPFKGSLGEVCMAFTFNSTPNRTSNTAAIRFTSLEYECGQPRPGE